MKYKLYTTSLSAWDAMLKAIDEAKKSIYLEMYIFDVDTAESHDFIGKLQQKARNGLSVVIVADAYGSKALKKELAGKISNSGIEFIFFSHWLRHIHRKVLIVDEKTAFIGGVNIGKRFTHWNDLQLKIGGMIVKKILKSFAYTYEMAGGKNKKILKYREKKFAAKLKFWIMEHWPTRNIYALKNHYLEKITQAKKSIVMVTPYFTPPRWMISVLDDAVRRNVKVEILVPAEVDVPIMSRVNLRYIHVVSNLGVKFHMSKQMNHAKLLLIDDEEGMIGSQNIDLASFRYNNEVGIFFKEKRLVKELSGIITDWKKNSQEFNPRQYKMRAIDYVIFALMKILKPIL
jgi:cardiolipin synthase